MGSDDRRLTKPECISPEIERQRARSAGSLGSRPASGFHSWRYSPIASVSQITTLPCVRRGTRNDGASSMSSARLDGSSLGNTRTSNSSPASSQSNQPRNDHAP
jgi:hypothetical protein